MDRVSFEIHLPLIESPNIIIITNLHRHNHNNNDNSFVRLDRPYIILVEQTPSYKRKSFECEL